MDAMTQLQRDAASVSLPGSAGGFMGLSTGGLVVSLIVSALGLFYYKLGRRDSDYFTVGTGVVLMAYPYFVVNTLYTVLIGAAIIGYHYYHTHYE